jgi:rfaE bifunctional protein kinase chain/domain
MTHALSPKRLAEILQKCAALRVAVLGDFNLDAYWYADMTRAELSREAPLYNRPVVRETYSPGGAANVAWNLADLGAGEVFALTVLGEDWRGDLLRSCLTQAGVRLDYLLARRECLTPMFGKVFLSAHGMQQEDARLDFVAPAALSGDCEDALIEQIERAVSRLNALVIADYADSGMITERVRERLNTLAAEYPDVVFMVDSRSRIGSYRGMVLKPNAIEAGRALFPDRGAEQITEPAMLERARQWQARTGRPLYITRGEQGCLLLTDDEIIALPGVPVPPPVDPVGAGDTFMSAVAAGLAAGATPAEAGMLGNLAAAVTVRKLRVTGTASPGELLALNQGA